jgi:hypothetical protein
MARKKSIKMPAEKFVEQIDETINFVDSFSKRESGKYLSWIYEYALIRIYRNFENLMLATLVAIINNDTSILSERSGFDFPKHLTDEVYEYLIVQNGYFDFKGRDGLIQTFSRFLPKDNRFIDILKKDKYRNSLEQLSALRNYIAHGSKKSKKQALAAVDQNKIGSVGAWLKSQNRFSRIVTDLIHLAQDIHSNAKVWVYPRY